MVQKKAQAWGIDLVVAVVIFMAGLVLFYFYAVNYPSQNSEKISELSEEARIVADSVFSEGNPENWNIGNVAKIGITSDGKIDMEKLENFFTLSEQDYSLTKSLFRIKNDYYVHFPHEISLNGQTIEGIGVPPGSADNVFSLTKVQVYGGEINDFEIYVWS